jgi:hypothetical protein
MKRKHCRQESTSLLVSSTYTCRRDTTFVSQHLNILTLNMTATEDAAQFIPCGQFAPGGKQHFRSDVTSFLTLKYIFLVRCTHICFVVFCNNQETAFGFHRTMKLTHLSVLSQCLTRSESFEVVNLMELSRCCVDITRILLCFMCNQSTV